jgi:hypothetical protein
MAAISPDAALDAYVEDMINNHTRLIEVTVCSHEGEWEATKHAYPAEAFKLLQAARLETGWSPENLVSDQLLLPEPLLDENGTFSAESSECSVCFEPLLVRPSVHGPFTVEFSLQVNRRISSHLIWISYRPQQYYIFDRPFHQEEGHSSIESPTVILHASGLPAPSFSGDR